MTLNGATNVDIVYLLNTKGLIFTFVPCHKYFIASVQQARHSLGAFKVNRKNLHALLRLLL